MEKNTIGALMLYPESMIFYHVVRRRRKDFFWGPNVVCEGFLWVFCRFIQLC